MSVIQLKKLLKSGSNNSLDALVKRAKKMQDLTGVLQAALSDELGDNLLSASLREDGEMVLICQTSAWASRIRFESEALLLAANENGYPATSCRVTVSHADR